MKKAIILIDGQNLYYGLKEMNILEKQIKWNLFFKSLITSEDELVRTYWFRPEKILDTYYTDINILNQIAFRQHNIKDYYKNQESVSSDIKTKIKIEVTKVQEWIKKIKAQFATIEFNYDKISLEYEDIEFVKAGVVKINPFKEEFNGEKGVDIALAVKMISLSVNNNCDKIILVSGDFDYAEAIKFVKNKMMKIHIVKIHKGIPPKNRSLSKDLALLADKVIDIFESELKTNFLKP